MWRLSSWTYWVNVAIVLLVALLPGLSDNVRQAVLIYAIANLGLREKTQLKVDANADKDASKIQ